ncbi:hypothetical protein I4F81_010185 [Pyropia yezoensis]|uniref:Uncharacterized protein n=1 Tax=Pyropia yezoensis TaxID=2788 RepID=A0ACC3CCG4_PYRYE|nr:hypothetical protein I4F81_010185 [Neopyropia yezoensis]
MATPNPPPPPPMDLSSLAILALSFLYLSMGLNHFFGPAPPTPAYAVMIDAGSTGTRAHIASFLPQPSLGGGDDGAPPPAAAFATAAAAAPLPTLLSYSTVSFPTPLTDLATSADAQTLFSPLLADVGRKVPAAARPRTPLFLRATAGVRAGAAAVPGGASGVMARAAAALEGGGYAWQGGGVLDGRVEGAYAWLSVNYLMGRLTSIADGGTGGGGAGGGAKAAAAGGSVPASSLGAMDLGGASLQVVRTLRAGEDPATVAVGAGDVVTLPIGRSTSSVVAFSYDGWGLISGTAQVLNALDEAGTLEAANPCFPPSELPHRVVLPGRGPGRLPVDGAGDFRACVDVAKALVTPAFAGLPDGDEDGSEYVAFAYLYDRTVGVGLAENATLYELWELGARVCQGEVSEGGFPIPEVVRNGDRNRVCLELAYVYALLRWGVKVGGGKRWRRDCCRDRGQTLPLALSANSCAAPHSVHSSRSHVTSNRGESTQSNIYCPTGLSSLFSPIPSSSDGVVDFCKCKTASPAPCATIASPPSASPSITVTRPSAVTSAPSRVTGPLSPPAPPPPRS